MSKSSKLDQKYSKIISNCELFFLLFNLKMRVTENVSLFPLPFFFKVLTVVMVMRAD